MKKAIPFYGLLLYAPGAIIILTLSVIATWSDFEATFYGFPKRAQSSLNGLRCPILMTRGEESVISVTISNPTKGLLSPSVKSAISTPLLYEETFNAFQLAPGESKHLEWVVDSDNIDMKNFIFARVLVYATYPIPDRETACGIFIIDVPGKGGTILVVATVLGFLLLGSGLFIFNKSKKLSDQYERIMRPVNFLSAVFALVMIVSFIGWWLQAIILLAVSLLAIVVSFAHILMSSK